MKHLWCALCSPHWRLDQSLSVILHTRPSVLCPTCTLCVYTCRVVELRYAIANDGTDHTLAQLSLVPCDDASPLKVGAGCWVLALAAVAGL